MYSRSLRGSVPNGASYRDSESGIVLVDESKCIGCQYCLYGCPYGVRQMDEEHGVAQKCTLCSQITADGSDVPACVHNCNCGARFFGDYDDPESDVCREMAKYSEECIHALPTRAMPSRLPATSCPRNSPVGRS